MTAHDALPAKARLRLAREGGLVAAPGLTRPREFALDDCAPAQRQRLAALIETCRVRTRAQPGRGDQRFFRLELWSDDGPGTAREQIRIDETDAPPELVALWAHGITGLD